MAVLIEGLSVVIRVDAINARYPGGWEAFAANAPNASVCWDGELARAGFMMPRDARAYVESLGGSVCETLAALVQRAVAVPALAAVARSA